MNIFIPTPLRQYAGKKDAVEVDAATVGEALKQLTNTHPDLKRHLYTDDGKLRAFVNVYLNDEDVRYLADKELTRVKEGDHLSIIPSIAGGNVSRCHSESAACGEESLLASRTQPGSIFSRVGIPHPQADSE